MKLPRFLYWELTSVTALGNLSERRSASSPTFVARREDASPISRRQNIHRIR